MSNIPAQLLGAVIFAWYPHHDCVRKPGPKYRPVLITDIDNASGMIQVAYGTSQHVDRQGRGEVVFNKTDMPGLCKVTKFCFLKTVWIPLSAQYLSKSQAGSDLTVLGRTPKSKLDDILQALEEIECL